MFYLKVSGVCKKRNFTSSSRWKICSSIGIKRPFTFRLLEDGIQAQLTKEDWLINLTRILGIFNHATAHVKCTIGSKSEQNTSTCDMLFFHFHTKSLSQIRKLAHTRPEQSIHNITAGLGLTSL